MMRVVKAQMAFNDGGGCMMVLMAIVVNDYGRD